jgi:hydrogenase maturation protease HycI
LKSELKKILSHRLKNTKKLVVLGIGSELMQDDAAGIFVTQKLIKKFGEAGSGFKIYTGYTTPENFTKNITDFHPDHIILFDAADLKMLPGSYTIIPVEAITDFSLGTHKLSLIMMIKYLKEVINPEFTVIAVQYKSIEFNGKMTKEVKTAVNKVKDILCEILESLR